MIGFLNFWFLVRCKSPVVMWWRYGSQNSKFSELQGHISLFSDYYSSSFIDLLTLFFAYSYKLYLYIVTWMFLQFRRLNRKEANASFIWKNLAKLMSLRPLFAKCTHLFCWNLWLDDIYWFKKLCVSNTKQYHSWNCPL